jgi:hypothetical protein
MAKIKQIDMLNELVTVFEERVLDDNCLKNNMKWDEYIKRIIGGWNPDNFHPCEYWLECYRMAIKKLKRAGKRTSDYYN